MLLWGSLAGVYRGFNLAALVAFYSKVLHSDSGSALRASLLESLLEAGK